jgi:hypothetical protein
MKLNNAGFGQRQESDQGGQVQLAAESRAGQYNYLDIQLAVAHFARHA